uniref:HECT domain-containing protein n=1 Tax=Labrus bergylta TaxID=56723 RepID=A0A3Q3FRE3_9LABR
MLCWGNASYGQLASKVHTAFLLEDGTVYTCGCNDLGQLGHDKTRKKTG